VQCWPGPGDELDPSQDPGPDGPPARGPICRPGPGRPQPRAAGAGARNSAEAIRPGSSATSTATSTCGWPSSPAPSTGSRAATGSGGSAAAGCETSASTSCREGAIRGCACLTTNDVGEPCAGEPHARFDRGAAGEADDFCGGRWSRAGALKDATMMARSAPTRLRARSRRQRRIRAHVHTSPRAIGRTGSCSPIGTTSSRRGIVGSSFHGNG
jgi:hypothetical protein